MSDSNEITWEATVRGLMKPDTITIGSRTLTRSGWAHYLSISKSTIEDWETELGFDGMALKIAEQLMTFKPTELQEAICLLQNTSLASVYTNQKKRKDVSKALDLVIAAAEASEKHITGIAARNLLNDFSFDILAYTKSMHPATLAALVRQLQDTLKDYGVVVDKGE